MQDTSTVAIVAMLASMAAVTNQAYASPWVPDLMIRAEPSDESSAKPEETKKDESKKEEPTSTKKDDPSPSSKADDKPTSFANAKPTSSSEPKDKSSSEKKPDPTSSSKKSEPTSSKKDDKSSSTKDSSSSTSTSSTHGFVVPATDTSSSTGSSASSSSSSGFVETGNKQNESSGMSGGAVAGVVIAVLVGVAAIAGFVILRKRRAQAARNRARLKPDPFTMGFGSHDPPPPHTAYNMASTAPSPMIQMPTLGTGAAMGAGAAAVGAGAYAATHNNDNSYGAQLHDAPYGGTQLQDNSPGYSAYNTQQPQPYTQDTAAYNTNMQDPNAYNNTAMQQQQQPATYDYSNTTPALAVNQAAPGTALSDAPPSLSPVPTHTDAFSPAMTTAAAAATGGVAAAAATTTAAPSTSPVTTPATAQPSGNSLGVFPVISTYTPTLSDELDIQPGDQVEVLVEYDDGWCQGVNLSRGSTKGVFPKHCVDFGQQTTTSGTEQSMKRVSSMIVDQQQQHQ